MRNQHHAPHYARAVGYAILPSIPLTRALPARLPSRSSLACIGIPDHRDLLAIYFRWVRQRYYRAHAEMGPKLASSARSTSASSEQREVLSPVVEMHFDMARLVEDVFGVGARFEGEATRYAREIDVLG